MNSWHRREPVSSPWWQLDARRVLAIALFVALFAISAREIADPDFWWHLKTGQYILETRTIPRHDVFSYTASDRPWITHEWLTQVLMIVLYRVGGLAALLLVTSALITCTFALVYVQCDARPHLAIFVVLLGALTSAIAWGARPQMVNLALAALFAWILQQYRRQRRRRILWLLPALTALWVNMHGGFFLGLGIVSLAVAGDLAANLLDHRTERTLPLVQVRDLAIALVASVAASMLNPNGPKMLWYSFETLGSRAMQQYIQEWASPDFHRPEYWPMILLLLGGAATMALTHRRRDLTDMLFFFGLGSAGLLSARHIPLFAVLAVPIVTRYAAYMEVGRWRWDLTSLPPARRPTPALVAVNWALVLLFCLAAGMRTASVLAENRSVEARLYPLDAIAYIEDHGLAGQRMYNSYNWGGYLIWRGYRVFIDGRADVYMDELINEYLLAYQLRGDWRQPLDRYGVDYVFIERGASLATLLTASDEWTRVYGDDMAAIFVRTTD
jgi:hypothetical protein